jgi:hypothetical protein
VHEDVPYETVPYLCHENAIRVGDSSAEGDSCVEVVDSCVEVDSSARCVLVSNVKQT